MTVILTVLAIIQSLAISLGVGASTLAIVNYFVAIADGTIDPNERKMMGVVYIVLRVAMIIILCTALILALYNITVLKLYPTAYIYAQWSVIVMLFFNAFLMSKHLIASNFGPALQAGSWYTLGILLSLLALNLHSFSYMQFVLGYIAALALAVAIVNGTMTLLEKGKRY